MKLRHILEHDIRALWNNVTGKDVGTEATKYATHRVLYRV